MKKHHHLIKLSAIFFMLISQLLAAQQLTFKKQQDSTSQTLFFQWQDNQKQTQQLSFNASNADFFQTFRSFRAYNSTQAQQSIVKKTMKLWRESPIRGVTADFSRAGEGYEISLTSNDSQLISDAQTYLKTLSSKAQEQYLAERYYHLFSTYDGITAVKPDHVKIANLSVPLLKPLKPKILATVELRNIRKVTNYVLNFIQSIPYSRLESRRTSAGAGFVPPLQLLHQNQGDCDSKVTLSMALLRSLMPRIEMIIVFIEGHALMGIKAPIEGNDKTLTHDNITYVLAEPTGPMQYALGQISVDSELAINAGLYSVEAFHNQRASSETTSDENTTNGTPLVKTN